VYTHPANNVWDVEMCKHCSRLGRIRRRRPTSTEWVLRKIDSYEGFNLPPTLNALSLPYRHAVALVVEMGQIEDRVSRRKH